MKIPPPSVLQKSKCELIWNVVYIFIWTINFYSYFHSSESKHEFVDIKLINNYSNFSKLKTKGSAMKNIIWLENAESFRIKFPLLLLCLKWFIMTKTDLCLLCLLCGWLLDITIFWKDSNFLYNQWPNFSVFTDDL